MIFQTTNNADNFSGLKIGTNSSIQKQAQKEISNAYLADVDALKLYQDGIRTTKDETAFFSTTMGKASQTAQDYAGKIKDSKGSVEAYTVSQKSAIVATEGVGVASGVAAVGVTLLKTALNMGIMIVAAAAIQFVVEQIGHLINAEKEASENVATLTSAFETEQSKLTTLQSSLKTTQDRMTELKSKGSLTIVEQAELTKLQQTNSDLEAQIKLQKELADMAGKKASDAALDNANRADNKSIYKTDDVYLSANGSYGSSTKSGEVAANITNTDYVKEQIQNYNTLSTSLDSLNKAYLAGSVSKEDYIKQSADLKDKETAAHNAIITTTSAIDTNAKSVIGNTDEGKAYLATIESLNIAVSKHTDLVNGSTSANDNNAAAQATAAEKLATSYTTLDSQIKAAQTSITDMGTNLKDLSTAIDNNQKGTLLDGEAVNTLIQKYPTLANKIIDTGNGYKFQSGALEEVRKAQMDQQTTAINAGIASAQATLNSVQTQINSYSDLIGAINTVAEAQAKLAQINASAQNKSGFIGPTQTGQEKFAINQYIEQANTIKKYQDQINALKVGSKLVGSNNYQKTDQTAENKANKASSENTALKAAEATLAYDKEMGKYTSDNLYKQISLNQAYEKQTENLKKYAKTSDEVYDINEKIYAAQQAVLASQKAYQQNNLDLSYKELDTRKALGVVQENSAAELQNLLEIQRNLNSSAMTLVNTDENRLALQEKIYSVQKAMHEADQENINNLLDETESMLKQKYDDEKTAHQTRLDDIKEEAQAKDDALDAESKKIKDQIQLQKDALTQQEDAYKHNEDQAEKEKAVTDLNSQIAIAKNDTSDSGIKNTLSLQDQLATAQKALTDFQHDYSVAQQQDALDTAEKAVETEYDAKKKLLDQEAQDKNDELQKEIDSIDKYTSKENNIRTEAMNLINTKSKSLYNDLIAYNADYGQKTTNEMSNLWSSAYDSLSKYGAKQLDVLSTLEKLTSQMQAYSAIAQTSATRNKSSIASDGTYLVKKNDTLSGIADYFGITLAKLKSANSNITSVTVGSKVKIPKYKIGGIDTTGGLAMLHGTPNSVETIFNASDGAKLYDFIHNTPNIAAAMVNKMIASTPTLTSSQINNNSSPTINMPFTIQGNADDNTVRQLKAFQQDTIDKTIKAFNKTRTSSGAITSVLKK